MKRIPDWKEKCILLAFLAAAVGLMWIFQLPCVWKTLLRIPCPGCGMTRAWVSALHLDLAGAFHLHPMFWSVPVVAFWWLFDGHVTGRRLWDMLIPSLIGAGFLINWLCQLI